jgi:hypothetical protein
VSREIDDLLSRLEGVRQYGDSYRARCPAHGGQNPTALKVSLGDDGRVLIHCFHGCSALDVVHAVGLELSDLFEQRLMHNIPPEEKKQITAHILRRRVVNVLEEVLPELVVITCAGADIVPLMNLMPLDHPLQLRENQDRVDLALERIQKAHSKLKAFAT